MDRVRVILGDTDRGDGFGSAGSRSLFTGGSAMRVGSERTIDHARQLAAKELEAAAEDIAYAVAYLASEEAGFVTGQVLGPNGGTYMKWC